MWFFGVQGLLFSWFECLRVQRLEIFRVWGFSELLGFRFLGL